MLLRIQSDESLRSFIARNIFLNWHDPEIKALDRLSKFAVCSNDVKVIAAAMGWFGCYGFNRLLHHHTFYPRYSIFKSSQDISYSHTEYRSQYHHFESDRVSAAFCPECVKEDLNVLGFSYWRRAPRPDIKVCAKHNVHLVSNCPFCGRTFAYKGHGLEVMWKGCAGRHLSEILSVKNEDSLELKKAKFFKDVFDFGFVIPIESALLAVNDKFLCLISSYGEVGKGVAEELRSKVRHVLKVIEVHAAENNAMFLSEYSGLALDSVLFLYESFNHFLEDVKRYRYEPRPVSSLWSTYRAWGSESAQYVEEDHVHGVGHWLCPYPSPLSQLSHSNDRYDRPTLYPCCNFPSPRRKGHQLSPRRVGPPLPAVPVLANHKDSSSGT